MICQQILGQHQKEIANGVEKVFPGAVGFGSQWVFTNNYEVKIVTNLKDSGPGSLREAITSSTSHNGKIIVFNGLSGVISLNSTIDTPSGTEIYIAGQTSENGIALIGGDWNGALLRLHDQVLKKSL